MGGLFVDHAFYHGQEIHVRLHRVGLVVHEHLLTREGEERRVGLVVKSALDDC